MNFFIKTPGLLVVKASAVHQSRVEVALDDVSGRALSSLGATASIVKEKNVAITSAECR